MKKPAVIVVLGTINITLAGMGLLSAFWGLISIFLMPRFNPMLEGVYTGHVLVLSVGVIAVGLITKTLMAVSGIGLLKGRRWGKSTGILWAWLSMPYGIAAAFINTFILTPAIMDATMNNMPNQGPSAQAQANIMQSMELFMLISGIVIGLAMALGYQITFLILIRRASITDYFAQADTHGAGDAN